MNETDALREIAKSATAHALPSERRLKEMLDIRSKLATLGIDARLLSSFDSSDGHTYFTFRAAADAEALWRTLRTMVPETGYWPVIVGDAHALAEHLAVASSDGQETVKAILNRAAAIDVQAWMIQYHKDRLQDLADCTEEGESVDDLLICSERDVPANVAISTNLYTTRRSNGAAQFVLVPTRVSHEVPAYLKFGGWNDCPNPDVQVAFHKYWEREYGSEIIVVADDVIETSVKSPPTDPGAALKLAKEQYLYCYDIVEQGTETITALAGGLLKSHYWFFWWD